MPQLHVNGFQTQLSPTQIAEVRQKLGDLKQGQVLTLEFPDDDGDVIWLRIPYEPAVMVLPWDIDLPAPTLPDTLGGFRPSL